MIKVIKVLFLVLSLFIALSLHAADSTKVYFIQKITQAPKIDGVLDDDVWKNAETTNTFIQSLPIEGAKPTQHSEVKLLYDNRALYIAAIMYDTHPDSILHELGNRDDQNLNADYFRIGIDPYNLRQDGYVFEVSAAGVQGDVRMSDGTYNTVWESKARLNKDGWVVEIKIPYSAIRFPKKPVQEWGLQFVRSIRRNREFDHWSLVPAGSNNPLLFWGTLKGIDSIQTPVRLSMTPYASFYLDQAPVYSADTSYSYSRSTSYNVGADLKYGIDDRFTLDVTLFPDFGQVQSDNKIKNLSYQEVIYNENRTFFKEGTELFEKNGLFYSRRIGKTPGGYYSIPYLLSEGESIQENPSQVKLLNATKLSGRTDEGLGLGFFNAITDNTYAIIEGKSGLERKILTEPLTNYNIISLDQQLKNNSSIYFINTNVIRDQKYDDANVTGTGFTFSNEKNTYAVDGSGNLSQLFSADTIPNNFHSLVGYTYFLGVRKTSGNFQGGLSRTVVNDTYNQNDMGYFTTNNFEHSRLYLQYFQFKPNNVFRDANHTISVDYEQNFKSNNRTQFQLNWNSFATFLNYHSIYGGFGLLPTINCDYNEPRVPGRYNKTIKLYYAYAGLSSDYRKAFAADITFNISNFIDQFVGEGYTTNVGLRYRFNDKFTLRFYNNFIYDPYNFGAVDWYTYPDTIYYGVRRLHTYENIVSGKYIFKNDMSLTLNARHYWSHGEYRELFLLEQNGELADAADFYENNKLTYNFNYNVFNIDIVYSWQFAPGSFMSVVYKNEIETNKDFDTSKLAQDFSYTMKSPKTNSLSLKLIYYLDYLSISKKGGG